MAFVAKNVQKPRPGAPMGGTIHVARQAQLLPQSTSDILFRVNGGKVRITSLIGTVTTAIAATDPVAKISSKALGPGPAAVGTAVDVAATVDLSSLEVGGMIFVKGDGTAMVKSTAGAAFIGPATGHWIAPQGEIYMTTTASKTGALRWDLTYEQIDEAAFVVASPVAVAI
jgi:hypothetical protein